MACIIHSLVVCVHSLCFNCVCYLPTSADVTVRFELSQYHINESAGVMQLRLILTGETSRDVAVAVATSDREAHGEQGIATSVAITVALAY